MLKIIEEFDLWLIKSSGKFSLPVGRLALFIVYYWFGVLKVLIESPANPLVESLLYKTLPFISFDQFIVWFGVFEMIIGIAFLVPGLERQAIALLFAHIIMTSMPLFLLPDITWTKFLIPTLEGQYILKNVVILALAMAVGSRLRPFKQIASS